MTHSWTRFTYFKELGLRGNPFQVLSPDELLSIVVLPPRIQALLAQGFTHLELIAPKGSGKTTNLLGLCQHFSRMGARVEYERLPMGAHRIQTHPIKVDIFAIDETQRLFPHERVKLLWLARRVRLLIGTHFTHRVEFALAGLPLVSLRVDHLTNREHLRQCVERRIRYFALDPDAPPITLSEDAIDWLWQQHGPDLRAVDQTLFAVFQRLPAPGQLTSAQLNTLNTR
ncbi:hypothetical protein VZO05_00445 [Aggregatilineales bacterium SYSU G02658]